MTQQVMTKLGLTLNEAKTAVQDARREPFDFLGYSFGPHRYRKEAIGISGGPVKGERTPAQGRGR